jgi:hypothetical protein
MRRLRALLAASVLAACSGATSPQDTGAEAAMSRGRDAQTALFDGRYDDAARLFSEMADAVEATGVPELQGHRDLALYNAACSLARAGRTAEAAETFARALEHGLRPAKGRTADGTWVATASLRLEHLLADPDLDPIRAEPKYREALEPYLAGGQLAIDLESSVSDAPLPALVVLAAPGFEQVSELEEPEGGLLFAVLEPPIGEQGEATPPDARRWLLADGDERWAVARIREALDDLEGQGNAAEGRVHLAGAGPQSGTAALHAALAMPDRLAGVVVTGARFHAAGVADDVAAFARAPSRPKIAVGPGDDELAAAFARAGVTVERAATPAEAVARWLR